MTSSERLEHEETVAILGAGQAGMVLAELLGRLGYRVVIANSRHPDSLREVVETRLGPRARSAWAVDAAAAADFAILAFPYAPDQIPPVAELAGKIVLDNNNYMAWRDGHYPEVEAGVRTVHELRQDQLPASRLVKAFSHIQFHGRVPPRDASDRLPAIMRLARPAGSPDRTALVVSSDFPDAVALVVRLYDELGFDAVDNSPLAESWRSAPGTPMWMRSVDGQGRAELIRNLERA